MTEKIKCPYCGSEHIAEYLRGLPVFDEELQKAVENGEVILIPKKVISYLQPLNSEKLL
jgi:primosomal protein N'